MPLATAVSLAPGAFYIVQRTSAARLWGGNLAWFVFWGYQLFIVMAATGYLLGSTASREYAEPEWYADLWLTVVWVAYLLVFLGTIMRRREPLRSRVKAGVAPLSPDARLTAAFALGSSDTDVAYTIAGVTRVMQRWSSGQTFFWHGPQKTFTATCRSLA